ncbi:DNA-directed RNA polymerases IV and V subunit 4 [Zostera marina]|uniref:DNA-directed RNA polymerases IV and V subunit 4 n=1 Tax=Zostera marina TaxID=29655 RepID=A0A0K9Q157_ZOSMR|nr:DNA-directed RNA polymerases IV and V subunit 4 [Zostera marina]
MQGKGGKGWTPTSKESAGKGKTKTADYDAIEFESPENSDSEGFVDEVKSSFSSKSAEKGYSETPKTGEKGSNKKSTLNNLKTGDKGKTFNVTKDGKGKLQTGVPKVPMEFDAKLQIELPKNSEIIMDCEAATILQGIQDYLPVLTRDSSLKMPISFTKAHQLANNGDHYTDVESVKGVLAKLKTIGFTDGEICMVSRVFPETTDEIFALIPSAKANKESINEILAELFKLKKCMQS